MRNIKIALSILTLSCILGMYSCSSPQASDKTGDMEKQNFQKEAIKVQADVAEKGVFYKEVISNGKLCPVKKAKLAFEVQEIIEKLHVKNGEWINKGDAILNLQNTTHLIALQRAHSQLAKAEIEMRDLLLGYSAGIKDTSNIEEKVLNTLYNKSGLQDAKLAIEEAKHNLELTNILAPFDGVISDLQVKESNHSSNYKYICNIMDTRQMEIEFGIMESELALVSNSKEVILKPFALPGKKFSGNISEINPSVNEHGMIMVKALINNAEGTLLDGMNAEVVVKNAIPNQLIVPKEAVLIRQNKEVVFTLKNKELAQWVYVKTAMENSEYYSIVEGLNEGDTIIVKNNFNLGHDVLVQAQMVNSD